MKNPFIDALCQSIRKVAEPRDYLTGKMPASQIALPENILFFSRHRAKDLQTLSSRHYHHRFVLLMAVQGTGRVLLDANSRFMNEGEALLFFPYQFHGYLDLPRKICWLFITFEVADASWLKPLHDVPPRMLQEPEMRLLPELLECWLEPTRHPLVPLHLALMLARLAARQRQFPTASPKASEAAKLLARINGYAIPRLNRPLALTEIATALGMSESHLRARFRTAVGGSLGRHLRSLRLYRASSLLHTTRMPVTEVAESCGFESLYAFSRAFKTARGYSPQGYRAYCETLASSVSEVKT